MGSEHAQAVGAGAATKAGAGAAAEMRTGAAPGAEAMPATGTDAAADAPEFFSQLLDAQYGAEEAHRIIAGCRAGRTVTLRANTLRASRDQVACALDAAGIAHEPVSWYDDAFVLPQASERDIWALEAYGQGALYLQSLSSMIPPLVLDAQPGEDVLDMCAAPGSKTTQIAALAGGKAHVTACEMHAPRAEKLEHNLRKLGADNVTVMRTDSRRLDDFFSFDRILVDAPCSGSGTLDLADPRTAKRFTPALVAKSRKAQNALLDKALRLVKPGGTVVYSTCSVLAAENDDIVEGALSRARKTGTFRLAPAARRFAAELPVLAGRLPETLTIAPTERFEGFYVARIVRMA